MNRLQFHQISELGNKTDQQDAVAITGLPSAVVVCVVDGMSAYREKSTESAPKVAQLVVQQVITQNPDIGRLPTHGGPTLLRDALMAMHRDLVRVGAGVACSVAVLTEDGTCQYASCGDVAMWARSEQSNEWMVLNDSRPHDNMGRLTQHLGAAMLNDSVIRYGSRQGVDAIVLMTDGFYAPGRATAAAAGAPPVYGPHWHPPEPPKLAGSLRRNMAMALHEARPVSAHLDDNATAAVVALVGAPQTDEDAGVPVVDERPTMWAMWAAVAVALAAVVLFGVSLWSHERAAESAVADADKTASTAGQAKGVTAESTEHETERETEQETKAKAKNKAAEAASPKPAKPTEAAPEPDASSAKGDAQ